METKNIILKLRTERGMSQDELADKIMVTRQAVSRWENGDTIPKTDTLKLLSKESSPSASWRKRARPIPTIRDDTRSPDRKSTRLNSSH